MKLILLVAGCLSSFLAMSAVPVVFEAKYAAVLAAERNGVLSTLNVAVGDNVKKGKPLFSVRHDDVAAELKRQRLQLAFLKKRIGNLEQLSKRGMASKDELAERKLERDTVAADVQYLQRQVSRATVRAPFAAVVIERLARRHEWVTAGQPVLKVLDPTALQLAADIPAEMASQMQLGETHDVRVLDLRNSEGQPQVVTAKLIAVPPAVETQSNTVRALWLVTAPPAGVLAGMKGELRMQ